MSTKKKKAPNLFPKAFLMAGDRRRLPEREHAADASLGGAMNARLKAALGDPEDKLAMVLDMKTLRPGCVLLQVFGGEGDFDLLLHAYNDIWLLAPTDDMRLVRGTRGQFIRAFELARKAKALE